MIHTSIFPKLYTTLYDAGTFVIRFICAALCVCVCIRRVFVCVCVCAMFMYECFRVYVYALALCIYLCSLRT
jgi:hypothetical protein